MAMKKRTTNINESARYVLGITRDEYALCQYYHYRAGDPRGKKDGWCSDPKDEVAEFIGITRPGLYKMIARLAEQRLLETDPETGFVRATGKWVDTESECKQSLHGGVNKVDKGCKQSLHGGVNKVYAHNKVEKDIELEELDNSKTVAAAGVDKTSTLKAEKNNPSPVPPTPSQSAPGESSERRYAERYDSFDIDLEAARLKTDFRCHERFASMFSCDIAIASQKIQGAVDEFVLDQKAVTYNYNSTKDFRSHFFNWLPKKAAAKLAKPTGNTSPQRKESVLPSALQSKIGR